ncbi:DUF3667 domain-containing protein [Winogradskyella haliclonae]|uniref:DUF3667 domain-containing protein n=1 Tax=Winogradskyella haliclonae TaxID=2048558 RepID=A0ABQ2C0Y5_9FLAO|nr:DUF3667 domain-containing protein [Winogradskyella haliclonae]GGI58196.1 hypothetical protein GCM10011444_25050 [Winogradskyella haliclonae]
MSTCKNCQNQLTPDSDYCNKCGARVIRNRLTFGNLFTHFSEEFLNYDNKLLQTFIALFAKPEAVIRSYISGTRKKYVNVISYFAIAITIAGIQLFILQRFFPEAMSMDSISTEATKEFNLKILEFIQDYQSIAMMLNVPIYALVSKLVFIGEKKFKYNYTEHLVIYMYLLAQLSAIGTVIIVTAAAFDLSLGTTSLILSPIQFIYIGYALKRIFNLDWTNFIMRTLIFICALIAFTVIASIVTGVLMYFNGDFQKMIEAQKAANEAARTVKDTIN